MTQTEWLRFHEGLCTKARELSAAKGHDYSGTDDTLRNLKRVERTGLCSTETGILVRLSDKFQRLETLLQSGDTPKVAESLEDTILDVVNYTLLLAAVLADKRKPAGLP